MKLFGRKQWMIVLSGLSGGVILLAILLRLQYGEINYLILVLTALVVLLIAFIMSRYLNK